MRVPSTSKVIRVVNVKHGASNETNNVVGSSKTRTNFMKPSREFIFLAGGTSRNQKSIVT